MWISKKKLEELHARMTHMELTLASLEESQKIKCEDENTRRAIRLLKRVEQLGGSSCWEHSDYYYRKLVQVEINQPTMNLRDAVLKIADHLGLAFVTEPRIVNNKLEIPALIPKDKIKEQQ